MKKVKISAVPSKTLMEKYKISRASLEDYIYTSIHKAIVELESRQNNFEIKKYVNGLLNGDIPSQLSNKPKFVLTRQVATPNFETKRFLHLCAFSDYDPLLLEYHQDKFTSNNEHKRCLGKMPIFNGYRNNRSVGHKFEMIVDFNAANGKKLFDVKTLWGESLISFHKKLFKVEKISYTEDLFLDVSDWLMMHGGKPKDFYKSFLALFMVNGILFENYLIEDEHENRILHECILPAFKEIYEETGLKPLIVPLEPTHVEGDLYWMCYSKEVDKYISDTKTVLKNNMLQ